MKKLSLMIMFVISIFMIVSCTQSNPKNPNPQDTLVVEKPLGNSVAVTIKGFKFVPADVTIKVGDNVAWTNEDTAPHTVESSDGTLKSDELSKGDKYSYTFTKARKYDYVCGIHPSMHGSVTVE